jgi:glycosyltransferase involved in cell wall biosynthesis
MEERIIVLTPVKNEGWILERFLTATSLFADHIIIADQASTDESVAICQKFPKVTVIRNDSNSYNEESRQQLLIDTARNMFPTAKRIFFALDADEIISADGLTASSWSKIRRASPGTSFYFEKPELLEQTNFCVRWPNSYFYLAYVDDGSAHDKGKKVHSKRLPSKDPEVKEEIDDIKFMHYALTRENAQSSKMRFYSVQEKVLATRRLWERRHWYKAPFVVRKYVPAENIEPTPEAWFKDYEQQKIDFKAIDDKEYSWHDFEVLKLFNKHGERAFYFENIWGFDWEKFRQHAISMNKLNYESKPIKSPSIFHILTGKFLDASYKTYLYFNRLRKRIK